MSKLQDVSIVTSTGPRIVRATVIGPLAVHASVDASPVGSRAYSITHRATGKRVGALPQKRYAVACARQLVDAVAWPDNGVIPGPDQKTAAGIIRATADTAFFAHCGL